MGDDDLAALGRRRDDLLRHITGVLVADARVGAVWLSGSLGRDQADDWSDLDPHVAVADAALPAVLAEREALFQRCGRAVLIAPDGPAALMAGARFNAVVYAGGVVVDWSIGPVSLATRRAATRVLFDRVGIPVAPSAVAVPDHVALTRQLASAWVLALTVAKHVGRGHTSRAARYVDELTYLVIILWYAARRPGQPVPDLGRVVQGLDADLDARLPRLGPLLEPGAVARVLRGLCAMLEELHPALAALGVAVAPDVAAEVARLIGLAEGTAARVIERAGEL